MRETTSFGRAKSSGSLLGAYFVLSIGMSAAAFLAISMARDPVVPLLIIGGVGAVVGLSVWLLRDRRVAQARQSLSWMFSRHARPAGIDYSPKVVKPSVRNFGTNHPPTADQLRQIKDESLSSWVPSNSSSGQKRPPQKRRRR